MLWEGVESFFFFFFLTNSDVPRDTAASNYYLWVVQGKEDGSRRYSQPCLEKDNAGSINASSCMSSQIQLWSWTYSTRASCSPSLEQQGEKHKVTPLALQGWHRVLLDKPR